MDWFKARRLVPAPKLAEGNVNTAGEHNSSIENVTEIACDDSVKLFRPTQRWRYLHTDAIIHPDTLGQLGDAIAPPS